MQISNNGINSEILFLTLDSINAFMKYQPKYSTAFFICVKSFQLTMDFSFCVRFLIFWMKSFLPLVFFKQLFLNNFLTIFS